MRVLVVDDNHDCADSQALVIKAWGFEVRVAYDGATALQIHHECCPDVTLIDIGMPEMDGCALARQLRAGPRCGALFALSGYTDRESRQQATAAGFDDYFVKPADQDYLKLRLVGGLRK